MIKELSILKNLYYGEKNTNEHKTTKNVLNVLVWIEEKHMTNLMLVERYFYCINMQFEN